MMIDQPMTKETDKPVQASETKAVGGIAPYGYRWKDGLLSVDEKEAPVRKLIYELFIKHKRKKTVAKLLNDLGYRTRNEALFSDTTIDRLLRDTTAKGIRIVDGKETEVEAIVSEVLWGRANNLLKEKRQTKPPVHLFTGIVFCECGGAMSVPSNLDKYICADCRHKILTDDLEDIFVSQLNKFEPLQNTSFQQSLSDCWKLLTEKEKRLVTEQVADRIVVGQADILIESCFLTNSFKAAAFEQQNPGGNESPETLEIGQEIPKLKETLNEPNLSEEEAAKFLNISKMTLMRRRKAGEIGFYQQGFRITYSKQKHLIPYLESCEKE